jgi:hypothetical protein
MYLFIKIYSYYMNESKLNSEIGSDQDDSGS